MFVVCLCIFERCSAFSYEQDMISIQFFCSYNNVQFKKKRKDFVNLLSEMWVTLCTLTWVRLQQVQEQYYPVLPVSVMFHCLPVVMQRGYVLILPRQLGECLQLQFGTALGLYLFDRSTVVWHTFFYILSPETRLSDVCVCVFVFPHLLG